MANKYCDKMYSRFRNQTTPRLSSRTVRWIWAPLVLGVSLVLALQGFGTEKVDSFRYRIPIEVASATAHPIAHQGESVWLEVQGNASQLPPGSIVHSPRVYLSGADGCSPVKIEDQAVDVRSGTLRLKLSQAALARHASPWYLYVSEYESLFGKQRPGESIAACLFTRDRAHRTLTTGWPERLAGISHPSRWEGMSVRLDGKREAVLHWPPLVGVAADTYIIERIRAGGSYTEVGRLPANRQRGYWFRDLLPRQVSAENISYRIRVIRSDGEPVYSPPASVWVPERVVFGLEAYPLPFDDVLRIMLPEASRGCYQVLIKDHTGSLLAQDWLDEPLADGIATWYPPAELSSGSYRLEVVAPSGTKYGLEVAKR